MGTVRNKVILAYVAARVRTQRLLEVPADCTDTSEEGSTTVEYAVGAVATAAFAGLLLAVLKSGGVKNMLNSIIQTALSM